MGWEPLYNKKSQDQEWELQCALAAKETNSILGCTYRITAESHGNLLVPSIHHLWDRVWRTACSFGGSSARKILTYWTERAAENTTCEERLQELGLFSLKTEKSRGRAYWWGTEKVEPISAEMHGRSDEIDGQLFLPWGQSNTGASTQRSCEILSLGGFQNLAGQALSNPL